MMLNKMAIRPPAIMRSTSRSPIHSRESCNGVGLVIGVTHVPDHLAWALAIFTW
jgi:hypothetical protein